MDLLHKIRILIGAYKFMQSFNDTCGFFIVLTDEAYIEADAFNITINDVTECIGIICSLNDGIILVWMMPFEF